jgi:hypothetical protein
MLYRLERNVKMGMNGENRRILKEVAVCVETPSFHSHIEMNGIRKILSA